MQVKLKFKNLLEIFDSTFKELPDSRLGSNKQYKIRDAALTGLSIHFMQSPSYRDYYTYLNSEYRRSNIEQMFGLEKIPSDNQLRNLLDPIDPKHLGGAYWEIYNRLDAGGYLDDYRVLNGTVLCGMDGTNYFSSTAISCPNCSTRERKGTTHYHHSAICPVLVAPNNPHVINLEPEFIYPQDGDEKQDCEQKAIKRWLKRNGERFAPNTITYLADDLHSHQPLCELLLTQQQHFIFVCKETSHKALYEEVGLLTKLDGGVVTFSFRHFNGCYFENWDCRYVNDIFIRGGEDALRVNWCEVTITDCRGVNRPFHCAFITSHLITQDTFKPIVNAGRSRWKNENESHNTLKNQGYNLDHNYGHGEKFFAMVSVSLNLLAFLAHTVLQLTDTTYQQIRIFLPSRIAFFADIRTLISYHLFHQWEQLLRFMLRPWLTSPLPP